MLTREELVEIVSTDKGIDIVLDVITEFHNHRTCDEIIQEMWKNEDITEISYTLYNISVKKTKMHEVNRDIELEKKKIDKIMNKNKLSKYFQHDIKYSMNTCTNIDDILVYVYRDIQVRKHASERYRKLESIQRR